MGIERDIVGMVKAIQKETRLGDKRAEQFWDRTTVRYLTGATYHTFQEWLNTTQSSGYVVGGAIIDDTDGTITVEAGAGFIKSSAASAIETTYFFDWPESIIVPLVDKKVNYIYVEYNAGTPRAYSTIDRTAIRLSDQFTLGRVYKDGGTLHVINAGVQLDNHVRKNHERLVAVHWVERASGGVISEPAALQLKSTAGVFYVGANEITTVGQDTSIADTFTGLYRDGAGGWTKELAQTDVNNEKYDDGDGGLEDIPPNKYSARYVYIDFDGHLFVQYGQQADKLAVIQAEEVPAPSDFLSSFAILAARVIVKDGVSPLADIASAYDTDFVFTGVSDHNDLSNLQGGAADQYYHMTEAEHTALGVGGAPSDSQFVVLALDGDLSAERVLAAGAGIGLNDGGANGNATIAISHLGLEALADPDDDMIMFWDDSAGALKWLAVPKAGGLAIDGTDLVLDFLGLEDLTDPDEDKILFWDDSAGALKWLAISTGLHIVDTDLKTDDSEISHAGLAALDGGGVGEHYHLSLAQHTDLAARVVTGSPYIVQKARTVLTLTWDDTLNALDLTSDTSALARWALISVWAKKNADYANPFYWYYYAETNAANYIAQFMSNAIGTKNWQICGSMLVPLDDEQRCKYKAPANTNDRKVILYGYIESTG